MKAGMGDGGPCHPRDNIALSSLAKRLELGYDLFGSIMHSREQQAKNLACFVFSHGKKICILGESFKPNSKIKTGSSSLLVAYYLKELGAEVCFDKHDEKSDHNTFLVAHRGCFYDYTFPENSIIIDPWREFPDIENSKVIHYGNTTNVL
jgi:UDPglucose 6-dehydrogenase